MQSTRMKGRICFLTYSLSSLPSLVLIVLLHPSVSADSLLNHWPSLNIFNLILVNALVHLKYRSYVPFYGIIWRACLLGSIFGASFSAFVLSQDIWRPLFIFFMVLSFFHFSEYFFTSISRPKSLNDELFLLNHSPEYQIALVLATTEFLIEAFFIPSLKTWSFISFFGFTLCIAGEFLRKTAMLTARSNFDHQVKNYKEKDHILVKHGIYAWSRHPAYVGWFYWAIGTQLILLNPLSFIIYITSSWKFLAERVYFEEVLLLRFFGEDYRRYQEKVPTRLPFIKGYVAEAED